MKQHEQDWHPVAKILYWASILAWIVFVLSFYSHPGGVLGDVADAILDWLTPKYVTFFMNTFSLVGAYAVTRLLLSIRVKWKTAKAELTGVVSVIWVAGTVLALAGARCDIYIFCSDDVFTHSACDTDWDRQGPHCR